MATITRAMISSTAQDLWIHRKAVMDACLSLDVFPSMMEHMPATDADAIGASLKMVDGADVYIGVFANRYGYVPEGADISITEMEYQRAIECQIPTLIFLIDPKHPAITGDSEMPENVAKLHALKERLKKQHVVNFFRSPDDLRANVMKSLLSALPDRKPTKVTTEAKTFSSTIKEQLALAHQTIQALTTEQYQVLDLLRYMRRVAIAGCAGSGKTLLAAEKAARLDKAGFRTMILCHSQYLAGYIRGLVHGTGVQVIDFTSWIHRIVNTVHGGTDTWTHYQEPTEEELAAAFDQLVDSNERYDAIIIDEGQDFRDEWWLIVEAALVNQEYGILYIFHDDNQALLPNRASYPITQAPISLSKNCRNAGEIFDVVRRFHAQSPETSVALKGKGIVQRWTYDPGEELTTVRSAVQAALKDVSLEDLVVLTTEPDPAESSVLNHMKVPINTVHRWQDVIMQYLIRYGHPRFTLSDDSVPNADDIRNVMDFAKTFYPKDLGHPSELRLKENWRWDDTPDGLVIRGKSRLGLFTFPDWADTLPEAPSIIISADEGQQDQVIRLATVSAYKGLEAPCVILFIPTARPDLEAMVYVGVSRAKFMLHVVAEKWVMKRVPQVLK
jgi:hypothetical protein